MKLSDLKMALHQRPNASLRFVLPDGECIPTHAHVTEVGHVSKTFIDCGGITGKTEAVLLQTHVGDDTEHRLTSNRFAKILELGNRVLPNDQLEVEIEYDCCVVAQYPIAKTRSEGEYLDLILGSKRTQCLARERAKIEAGSSCECC